MHTKNDVFSFDFLVFIGRFQPFHNGHAAVIKEGLARSKHLIILCGSAHQPRSIRNPWNSQEREEMVRGAFSDEQNQHIHFAPLMDMIYNDERWVRNVQATVSGIVTSFHGIPHQPAKIGLIGHRKDQSSYYLNLFPQWAAVEVANVDSINASSIRETIFAGKTDSKDQMLAIVDKLAVKPDLTENVLRLIRDFCTSEIYQSIKAEHDFVTKYHQAWKDAPYPPTFVTVDAVVVQSGHVLLVERKARPGKGLMALPGGFVGAGEKLVEACLRELREETRVKIPIPVLKGSIKGQKVFDEPHRSARGRTITHAFYLELQPNQALPKVKGGDDAARARWTPLAELDPMNLFEDHYFIIQNMVGS